MTFHLLFLDPLTRQDRYRYQLINALHDLFIFHRVFADQIDDIRDLVGLDGFRQKIHHHIDWDQILIGRRIYLDKNGLPRVSLSKIIYYFYKIKNLLIILWNTVLIITYHF